MPNKIVYDTMTGKFMDPFKVEIGQFREMFWASKHKTHDLVKDGSARVVSTYMRSVSLQKEVARSEADWARHSWQ